MATTTITHLAHTLAVIGGRGGLVQLLGGDQQLVLALLQVLLQALHPPAQSKQSVLSFNSSKLP